MRIALDVDGVLADVIHAWLSYNNGKRSTMSKSDISEWDFWKKYDINKFDFYAELSMCWKSWKTIPPTESDISYASKELSKVGTVDIVTAREDSTHEDVKSWLKMHNVIYKNYVGVKEGSEKAKLDYDVFIDDSPINAQHMLATGKPVIIYNQPWNLDFYDTRAKRINELKNATNIIKETISRN
ncbi:5' nucleotidase, deoxy (Pyrimidine), cytosolic type C protein (NT5C) [uncultured archaeon]|nr:5' nucleotidase, deoxy (Pyrimidine), cytosolic type C protein (NT5C) [uncultured archaeon]